MNLVIEKIQLLIDNWEFVLCIVLALVFALVMNKLRYGKFFVTHSEMRQYHRF